MPDLIIIDAGAASGCRRCHHDLELDDDTRQCGRCGQLNPAAPDSLFWRDR